MNDEVRYVQTPNAHVDFAFSRLLRVTNSLNQTALKGAWSFSLRAGDEPICEITYVFNLNGEKAAITLKASTDTIEYGSDTRLRDFLRKEVARQIGSTVWEKSGNKESDE